MRTVVRTDVVCLGESMVTFLPSRAGRLADVPSFERAIGGAESNVACALAGSGHSVRWVSRVGADGFGDHLVEAIAARGVDVGIVGRDARRPTGIYFRTEGERPTTLEGPDGRAAGTEGTGGTAPTGGTAGTAGTQGTAEVVYYRAGSAASAMSPHTVDLAAVDDATVLHVTGITAALSPECLELMRLLTGPRADRPLVSFDVNYRVGLWDRAEGDPAPGPGVLLELAAGCDLVFVGEDEAAAAWGVTGGPPAIRELLPGPAVLVVKQGGTCATAFVREDGGHGGDHASGHGGGHGGAGDTVHAVPALRIDVADAVGAGDGFAAGFLSATLRGLPVRERLRHGHLTAAAALTVPGDLAEPPPRDVADRLAALDDEAWGRLRLGPGWNTQKANAT
ncbi:carbohydrate kinase [Streptomyces abyssalis]|uniref:Carbohydrate kinase n=1 Tax=Streptomyces abyssalis TaxID=933944 RepID=A0A1E7JG29_9ACTN|nr:sugar kinase [Streptomyces abyssalis]OEU85425.1 carbohydrate kinase [Streptomyces abyssalis]OEU93112.1 carbohydrate kinase [Streptomyces abyssalis]